MRYAQKTAKNKGFIALKRYTFAQNAQYKRKCGCILMQNAESPRIADKRRQHANKQTRYPSDSRKNAVIQKRYAECSVNISSEGFRKRRSCNRDRCFCHRDRTFYINNRSHEANGQSSPGGCPDTYNIKNTASFLWTRLLPWPKKWNLCRSLRNDTGNFGRTGDAFVEKA